MFTRSAAGKPEIDVPHKGNVDRNAVFRHEHDGGRADVPLAGNVDRNMLARCTAASALGRSPLRGTRIEMPGALNRRLYLRRCYLDGAELNMGVICSKRPGVFSGPFCSYIQMLLPAAEPSPMASQEVRASTASPAIRTSMLGSSDLMAALSGSQALYPAAMTTIS